MLKVRSTVHIPISESCGCTDTRDSVATFIGIHKISQLHLSWVQQSLAPCDYFYLWSVPTYLYISARTFFSSETVFTSSIQWSVALALVRRPCWRSDTTTDILISSSWRVNFSIAVSSVRSAGRPVFGQAPAHQQNTTAADRWTAPTTTTTAVTSRCRPQKTLVLVVVVVQKFVVVQKCVRAGLRPIQTWGQTHSRCLVRRRLKTGSERGARARSSHAIHCAPPRRWREPPSAPLQPPDEHELHQFDVG